MLLINIKTFRQLLSASRWLGTDDVGLSLVGLQQGIELLHGVLDVLQPVGIVCECCCFFCQLSLLFLVKLIAAIC